MPRKKLETQAAEIYGFAKDQKIEDQLEDELASFASLLRQNHDLKLFLEDKAVSAEYKKNELNKMFPKDTSRTFILLINDLVESEKISLLPRISLIISNLLSKDRGIVFGEARSASPLPDKTLRQLEAALGNVKLRPYIDPGVLGGVKIALNNQQVWDLSIAAKLKALNNLITKG